ncbi:MAG: ABC-2 family transporter protein [Oscillospiraceae bacterium]|nr:ABC-2 family transporter protein [Oscillospiraceae bacterium]
MKKYLYGFKMYFLNSFNYRFNTVVSLIFGNIGILIEILFWGLIYAGDMEKTLNGYNLSAIITYYFVGGIFRRFIFWSGVHYNDLIRNGTFGQVLVKPYNASVAMYFKFFAESITSILPQTLFVIASLPFIGKYLTWNLNLTNAIFLILFLIISSISSHLLHSICGYAAFWIENSHGVIWSFVVFFNLVTGMFIPLDFFPKWSLPILERMPFASWGYLPGKIYLGLFEANQLTELLFIHVLWIGILFCLNKIVFDMGVKKYSSVGG